MAKQLQRTKYGVSFGNHDEYQPSCMWGIFHVLDYHYWHHAKKMQHKKNRKGRHAICCKNPKTISMEHNVCEAKPFLDVEPDLLQVEEQLTKTSSSRAKTLANTEEKPHGRSYNNDWNSGFTSRSHSQQTDSIEHFKSGWINPIILVHNNRTDTSAARTRSLSVIERNKEFSDDQVKEYVDVLEILNVKKDLFLNILEDTDLGVPKSGHGKPTHKPNTKFSKSGSFPLSDSSRARYLKPTTLEHKQNDKWSFPKGKLVAKKKSKPNVKSMTSRPNVRNVRQDNQGWSHTVMNHYKEIKQKIKRVLKNKRSSSKEDGVRDSKGYNGHFVSDGPHMTRTTTSVNDPLDRYARLLDHGVSREAKWDRSKSLKVKNDDSNIGSRGRSPNFFRRISSLSDIESFYSFLNEVSRDSFSLDVPFRSSSNIGIRTEPINEMTVGQNEGDNFITEKFVDNNADFIIRMNAGGDVAETSSDSVLAHNTTGHVECLISEGFNLDVDGIHIDGSNTLLELEETLTEANSHANEKVDNEFEHFAIEEDDIGYFNYVRNVLELSGFLGNNNHLEKWHSQSQPINPTLFKDLEVDSEHELLFDLINETLVEIRDNSFAYFPRSRVYSLPKGRSVLKEVWTRIGRRLESGSKLNQSLDDIVGRDFVDDSWMKLELDAEFVELEVDELIFDELLNELVCEVNQMKR